jgi:CTP synthase
MHVTLIPWIPAAKEMKTKPTQHSVKELRTIGLQPNLLLCRSERAIPKADRQKIALFCNVPEDAVFEARDAETIYEVPLSYRKQGVDKQILKHFNLPFEEDVPLQEWQDMVSKIAKTKHTTHIAIVGKYTGLKDAYKSLIEAVYHAGIANDCQVEIHWIDARKDDLSKLESVQGIIVPGGFGEEGVAGKIAAAKFARENNVPYLGICFGMQMAVLEAMRNLVGIKDASSSEFGVTSCAVVGLMTEWKKEGGKEKRNAEGDLGGTMRLGSYPCAIEKGTLAHRLYGATKITERHRHRYEVNAAYIPQLEKVGMRFSGMSPDGKLPEIVEIPNHPWFVGVQFHPEFKSTIFHPHPLFTGFIGVAKNTKAKI